MKYQIVMKIQRGKELITTKMSVLPEKIEAEKIAANLNSLNNDKEITYEVEVINDQNQKQENVY